MENTLNCKIGRLHRLAGDSAMKAFADIIISDAILIKGLRVVEGKNGLFVSMPKQQGKDSKWYDTIQPVTKEAREEISSIVLEAYKGE
ncbi:septation protein SpoVG family protein [Candidatus Omnitrophota bacterium]